MRHEDVGRGLQPVGPEQRTQATTPARRSPARNGWSGSSSCAQVVHTRCGSFSWNLGGSIMRSRQQASQKMKPQSRQWCRSRVNGLQRELDLVTNECSASGQACMSRRAHSAHVSRALHQGYLTAVSSRPTRYAGLRHKSCPATVSCPSDLAHGSYMQLMRWATPLSEACVQTAVRCAPHLNASWQAEQSPACESGTQVGGSRLSRSPSPSSTVSRSTCSGGALGTCTSAKPAWTVLADMLLHHATHHARYQRPALSLDIAADPLPAAVANSTVGHFVSAARCRNWA